MQARRAFCAVRPPGHHSGPYGMVPGRPGMAGSHGFCLLNNIAIGAAYALSTHRHAGALQCCTPLHLYTCTLTPVHLHIYTCTPTSLADGALGGLPVLLRLLSLAWLNLVTCECTHDSLALTPLAELCTHAWQHRMVCAYGTACPRN